MTKYTKLQITRILKKLVVEFEWRVHDGMKGKGLAQITCWKQNSHNLNFLLFNQTHLSAVSSTSASPTNSPQKILTKNCMHSSVHFLKNIPISSPLSSSPTILHSFKPRIFYIVFLITESTWLHTFLSYIRHHQKERKPSKVLLSSFLIHPHQSYTHITLYNLVV